MDDSWKCLDWGTENPLLSVQGFAGGSRASD
jgi:hypothetical protein